MTGKASENDRAGGKRWAHRAERMAPSPEIDPENSALKSIAKKSGVTFVLTLACKAAAECAREGEAAEKAKRTLVSGTKATVRKAAIETTAEGLKKVAGKTILAEGEKTVAKTLISEVEKKAAKVIARETEKVIVKQSVKEVGAQGMKQAAKAAVKGNIFSSAAVLLVDQAVDTGRLAFGKIDGREYGARTAENVGSATGTVGGATAGAAIGTFICPGIGTAVGGLLGGIAGSLGGGFGMKRLFRR